MTSLRARINTFPPILWLLGIATFLNVIGLSFIWPISTIYIHEHLGRPLTVAGIVLLLSSLGGVVGSLLGGLLFDRFGARPVLLTGFLGSALFILLPGLSESWPLYIAVMILYGVTSAMPTPALNALVARAWPAGGRQAFNFLYVAWNVGVAVGTVLGGLLAEHNFALAFRGATVMMFLTAVYVYFAIHDQGGALQAVAKQDAASASPTPEASAGPATGSSALDQGSGEITGRASGRIPWIPVIALFGGLLLCWLIYVQWLGAVPVWMQSHGLSLARYSFLWTLNGLIIVVGQPLMTLLLKVVRSLFAQLFVGVLFFAACFGLLLMPPHYSFFVGAMVMLTAGEMLVWPAVPAAMAEISPPDRKGFLQGLVNGAVTAGRMLGPLAGGLIFDHYGYYPLMVVMTAMFALPAICFILYRSSVRSVVKA